MNAKNKIFTPKILLIDLLIAISFLILAFFSMKNFFILETNLNSVSSMSIYIPLFVSVSFILGFILFISYKYKCLNLKNIFIYLAVTVAIFNLLATICIPNNYALPYGEKLNLDFNKKMYSSLLGFVVAFLLILYFYIFPKRFNNSKYVSLIFLLLSIFTNLIILYSLIAEAKVYLDIIKSGFSTELAVKSFVGHKNSFGQWIFIGISSTLLLVTLSKKIKWLSLIIPMVLVLPFTQCKISILLSGILILFYIIYKLILFAKFSKDNLFITLICSGFIFIFTIIISILIVNCNSGLLFKIKNLINKVFTQGTSTIKSRIEIWKCAFALLSPLQIIIGCGASLFNEALHITYSKAGIEDATHIWNAHNGIIELIGEGGVILLLINILLLVIIIISLIKISKVDKVLFTIYLAILILYILYSFVEPVSFTGFDNSLSFNFLIVVPIMSIARYSFCKEAKKTNKQIVELASQIEINKNENLFIKLNKLYIKLNSKCIRAK